RTPGQWISFHLQVLYTPHVCLPANGFHFTCKFCTLPPHTPISWPMDCIAPVSFTHTHKDSRTTPAGSGNRWDNPPRRFAEADAVAGALAPGRQGDAVAVLEKRTRFAVGKYQGFTAAPRKFQEAAIGVRRWAADRAAGQQVSGAQIASVDCV